MTGPARRLGRIDFTTADLAQTLAFYTALGFTETGTAPVAAAELRLLGLPGSRADRLSMRLGLQEVSFLRFDPPGRAYPAGSTSTDLWFQHMAIVVSDMAEAHGRALAAGAVPISRDGPQTLPPQTGSVTAFKFRDPDGHPLELLFFPEGAGAAVWQARDGVQPFLGIDHTAISVSDASRTQAFFEALGFVAGAPSHNEGPGQERLDDIAGARCLVVPLKPKAAPPHIELLAYEVGLRRPMPAQTRADDIWATRVWLDVGSLEGPTTAWPDGGRRLLTQDPDGHAVVLATDDRPVDIEAVRVI